MESKKSKWIKKIETPRDIENKLMATKGESLGGKMKKETCLRVQSNLDTDPV